MSWCFKVLLSQGFQTAWQDFAAEAAGLGWPLGLCSMRCHHSSHPSQLISGGPYHHSLCVVSTVVSILCSTSYMSRTACQRPSFWGLVLPGRGRMPWRWRQRRDGKEQLLRGQSTDNSCSGLSNAGTARYWLLSPVLFQTGKPYPARLLIGGWGGSASCGLISKSG